MDYRVLICSHKNDKKVDLKYLLKEIYKYEISSVLVEGGGQINGTCFDEKLVDKIYFFTALKIIGGENAVNSVSGKGISSLQKAVIIDKVKISKLGKDLLIEGKVKYSS